MRNHYPGEALLTPGTLAGAAAGVLHRRRVDGSPVGVGAAIVAPAVAHRHAAIAGAAVGRTRVGVLRRSRHEDQALPPGIAGAAVGRGDGGVQVVHAGGELADVDAHQVAHSFVVRIPLGGLAAHYDDLCREIEVSYLVPLRVLIVGLCREVTLREFPRVSPGKLTRRRAEYPLHFFDRLAGHRRNIDRLLHFGRLCIGRIRRCVDRLRITAKFAAPDRNQKQDRRRR
jgi:hypothetical protein